MDLLIVTGLSGAGKSLAVHALEDMGYFCIDNIPAGLLASFARLTLQQQVERDFAELEAAAFDGVTAEERGREAANAIFRINLRKKASRAAPERRRRERNCGRRKYFIFALYRRRAKTYKYRCNF